MVQTFFDGPTEGVADPLGQPWLPGPSSGEVRIQPEIEALDVEAQVAEIDLPCPEVSESLEILDIGNDNVLGLRRDPLGVERVRLHRLDRN
ncbi:MAG: hypothetical protein EA351_13610 [Gemmatimonadales bacterium]|nr:MAG: hypothetical protein EA351_13610 [Gemmatimonadales bacterium]